MRKLISLIHVFAVIGGLLLSGCSKDDTPSGPAADTEKPVVNIISPQMNEAIKADDLAVEASATDNVGVVKVEFFIDAGAAPAATLTTAPWKTSIPISGLTDGSHTLVAKAYDAAGNIGESSPVTFRKEDVNVADIRLKVGSKFTYNRWDLDETNQPLNGTKRIYTSELIQGTGASLGGFTDWVYEISTDNRTLERDTMILRTNQTGDLMSYGFITDVIENFVEGAGSMIPLTVTGIPKPSWDYLAKFNNAGGSALPLGTEWDVTPPNGVTIFITIEGIPLPIPVTIRMKGKLDARGEMFTIGGKQIRTWKVMLTMTMSMLGNPSEVKIHIWFSDDPDGQIKLMQESATIQFGVSSFDIPGDLQELTSWQE